MLSKCFSGVKTEKITLTNQQCKDFLLFPSRKIVYGKSKCFRNLMHIIFVHSSFIHDFIAIVSNDDDF